MNKTYHQFGTHFSVEDGVSYQFLNRCKNIVKNWETDGSKKLSGVSISSVVIRKDMAIFYYSGYYIGRWGEYKIMEVYSDKRKSKIFSIS